MAMLEQRLIEIGELSTVGVTTLSGRSPLNTALTDAVAGTELLLTPDDQVSALHTILRRSAMLWPDQHTFVVSTIIHDIAVEGRVKLHPDAYARLGRELLHETTVLAPRLESARLVNDTLAYDTLTFAAAVLAGSPIFRLPMDTDEQLDAAGLRKPLSHMRFRDPTDRSPDHIAHRIRREIMGLQQRQVQPYELARLIDQTARLPNGLRGRMVTLLINLSWNIVRQPRNAKLIDRLGRLVDDLPPLCRVTALEALHNQMYLLPNEAARACHPIVVGSVGSLPLLGEPTYERLRGDLITALRRQGELLDGADFAAGESISSHRRRRIFDI